MLYSWVVFYCLEMEYGCYSLNGISKPVVSSLCNRNSRWWLSLNGFFAKVNQLYHFFLSVPVPQPLSWHHHPLGPKNSNHLLFPHSSYQIVHWSPVFFFLFFSAVAQSFIALWLTESKYWWLVTALNGWRSLLLVSSHSSLIPPMIYVRGVQVTFPKLVF